MAEVDEEDEEYLNDNDSEEEEGEEEEDEEEYQKKPVSKNYIPVPIFLFNIYIIYLPID